MRGGAFALPPTGSVAMQSERRDRSAIARPAGRLISSLISSGNPASHARPCARKGSACVVLEARLWHCRAESTLVAWSCWKHAFDVTGRAGWQLCYGELLGKGNRSRKTAFATLSRFRATAMVMTFPGCHTRAVLRRISRINVRGAGRRAWPCNALNSARIASWAGDGLAANPGNALYQQTGRKDG